MEIVANNFPACQEDELLVHLFLSRVHKRHSTEPGPQQNPLFYYLVLTIKLKVEIIELVLQVRKLSLGNV